MIGPQVAFSKDFMVAYSRLPKKQQKKVREFTEKFQQDPTQSGINFERLEGAVDNKVRSVRIDQAYRAIIIHPPGATSISASGSTTTTRRIGGSRTNASK